MPAVEERVKPTVDARLHEARRMVRYGKMAVEDGVDAAALKIRRKPIAAVVMAFFAGGLVALVAGMFARVRRPRE
jgi:hypothetical protein